MSNPIDIPLNEQEEAHLRLILQSYEMEINLAKQRRSERLAPILRVKGIPLNANIAIDGSTSPCKFSYQNATE